MFAKLQRVSEFVVGIICAGVAADETLVGHLGTRILLGVVAGLFIGGALLSMIVDRKSRK